MSSMDMGLELCFGKEAAKEIILTVDFKYRAGCGDYFAGGCWNPGDPAEVEVVTVFWPTKRYDRDKGEWVDDHIEMPINALPDEIFNAIEGYIIEKYVDDYEPYDI